MTKWLYEISHLDEKILIYPSIIFHLFYTRYGYRTTHNHFQIARGKVHMRNKALLRTKHMIQRIPYCNLCVNKHRMNNEDLKRSNIHSFWQRTHHYQYVADYRYVWILHFSISVTDMFQLIWMSFIPITEEKKYISSMKLWFTATWSTTHLVYHSIPESPIPLPWINPYS